MVAAVNEKFKLNERRTLALIKAIVELRIVDIEDFLKINGIEFEDFNFNLKNIENKCPELYMNYINDCLNTVVSDTNCRRKIK